MEPGELAAYYRRSKAPADTESAAPQTQTTEW
ncbi:hypothetical protein SNOG_13384 [Parastagonospora nodorum SN15]|uniref:Uncharacterized protein n=1 Tax=Phaeosphaeria nodorum (strain SN15 / ATCC MYA-4574 / FGSC 10173) TaxID=321614 RepID=Q0U4D0_PHANO|nr:hypothetical protein SNOG_13384 [Parastagonospora nodorum SN15]EAT79268.1 hypothetical protein SNOG_13384 [Parastagonospora nodorum SN15]